MHGKKERAMTVELILPELILRGGRVVDPSQGLYAAADVAFAGGKVKAVGPGLEAAPGTDGILEKTLNIN